MKKRVIYKLTPRSIFRAAIVHAGFCGECDCRFAEAWEYFDSMMRKLGYIKDRKEAAK